MNLEELAVKSYSNSVTSTKQHKVHLLKYPVSHPSIVKHYVLLKSYSRVRAALTKFICNTKILYKINITCHDHSKRKIYIITNTFIKNGKRFRNALKRKETSGVNSNFYPSHFFEDQQS